MEQTTVKFNVYHNEQMIIVYFLPFTQTQEEYLDLPIATAKILIGENGEYGKYENIGTADNQIMLMNNGKWFLQISEKDASHIPLGNHKISIHVFDKIGKQTIEDVGTVVVKNEKEPVSSDINDEEIEEFIQKNMTNVSDKEADNVTPLDLLSSKNYTTKEIRNERFDICKECPRLFKPTKTCKECGCFMAAKTWLKDATCPIGKW